MSQTGAGSDATLSAMDYGILINRKRAIIALVHSVAFLGIAMIGLQSPPKSGLFTAQGLLFTPGRVAIFCVYLIVTTVLLILTRYSRCRQERAYFSFCSASAGVGLLRALFGDPVAYVGPVARVLLLLIAVIVGFAIFLVHSQPEVFTEN